MYNDNSKLKSFKFPSFSKKERAVSLESNLEKIRTTDNSNARTTDQQSTLMVN